MNNQILDDFLAERSAKVRPQWRMSVTSKLSDHLGKLYDEVKELSLSEK
jgi:hypothetical protein